MSRSRFVGRAAAWVLSILASVLVLVVGGPGTAHATVVAQSGSAPTITTTSVPDAVVGDTYSFGFSATGTPTSWSMDPAALPGMELDSQTGVLYGTPSPPAATFTITITATNDAGSDVKQFTVRYVDAGQAPSITSGAPPAAVVGQPYQFTFTATGSPPPSWSATGLPSGLGLNSASGVLSGTPTTAGTSSLVVTAANGTSPDSVRSYSLTVAPASTGSGGLVVEPSTLAFGDQVVGTRSDPKTVTLRNTSGTAVTVTDVRFSGPGFVPVDGASACNGGRIAAGASCVARVAFAPTRAGAFSVTATVLSTAANSPATVRLTGSGVVAAPRLVVEPTSLAFGPQRIGTRSAPRTAMLRNTGNAPATIGNPTFSGPGFSVVSTTCGSTLAAGASCQAAVVFTPTQARSYSVTLTLRSNAANSPTTLQLSGIGTRS